MNPSKQRCDQAIAKAQEVKRRCVPAKDEAAHKHMQFVLDFLDRARAKLPNEESFPKPDKDGGDTPAPQPEPAPEPVAEGEKGPDPSVTAEAGLPSAGSSTPDANPHGKARGKKS